MFIPQTNIIVTVEGSEILRRTVPPGDYVIGSGKDADIVVECDGVSTRHAQLMVNFNELLIQDLGSKNGILVNGRAVSDCVRIWPNQKVQIGLAVFEMHRVKDQTDSDFSFAPQSAAVRRFLPEEFLHERKYEIGSLVAEGGMGAVLNAYEATTGRTVAMKVLLSDPRPGDLLRFIKEAQITSQLEHPNIVPLHELGVDEHDELFYTMKLVEGITLRQVLDIVARGTDAERARYSLTQLLTLFQKVCDAIGFAHSRQVIHRDLKPDNIMVGDYGEVLVMDWGLAKVLEDSSSDPPDELETPATVPRDTDPSGSATMAGSILGTPLYMPPEQANGDIAAQDQRSDIYSLGAILYQILALRPPVTGQSQDEIFDNVRAGRIEPLHPARAPTCWPIPESLAAVAMKALALEPARRYATVQELQKDIAAYQGGFATVAEEAGLGKQLSLLIKRHQREAAILAAGIMALLGIVAFAFVRVTRDRSIATIARQQAQAEQRYAEKASASTVADRTRAESERNRANTALAELRKAAPAFQGQAGTLIEEQKFDEALEKNRLAVQLEPDNTGYHLFRAHTLTALQRLAEAAAAFRRVLALQPDNADAKSNLALCERLLTEAAGKPLDRTQQTRLLDAILAQKRTGDSVLLARALGRQTDIQLVALQTGLKTLTQQERWSESRLKKRADGSFALDLSDLVVPDLSFLRGLPIGALKLGRGTVSDLSALTTLPLKELDCSGNPVRDLSPIRELPIERLNLSQTKVTDLAALEHLPLQRLSISFTSVSDLKPLQKLPLQTLSLAGLSITSIEPLRGMPLRELDLFGCRNLTNLSPLAGLPALESVNLPAQTNDLAFVRQLRSLRRLGNSFAVRDGTAFDKLPTVAEFFSTQGQRLMREKQYGPRLEALRGMLRKFGAPESIVAGVVLDSEGFINLDLTGLVIPNLSALSGLPIRNLIMRRTGITDLTPLAGMPLASLDASENPISNLAALASCTTLKLLDLHGTEVVDLRPLGQLKLDQLMLARTRVQNIAILRGMPLVEVDLSECLNLTDLSPLIGCLRLETLLVPANKPDDKILRQIPNLQRLARKSLDSFGGEWTKAPSAKGYFAAAATLDKLRAELRKLGATETRIAAVEFTADDMLDLDLSSLPISDISFLANIPIRSLRLDRTPVTDLSALAGAPIQKLEMRETQITDLGALRGAPLEYLEAYKSSISDLSPLAECRSLRSLRIAGTQVADLTPVLSLPLTVLHILNTKITDVSPAARCETLEAIEIPKDATGVEALRKLPHLQRISTRYDGKNNQVAQTAEEFWREFDAQKKAAK
jgi:serine/threonine protein kinase/Leucine-rich repeat (LRR) protein